MDKSKAINETEFSYTSPVTLERLSVTLTDSDFYSMPKPVEMQYKRKCVLIGRPKGNGKVEVDMVNLSISKMLNNGQIELLDHADISDDNSIYLVTHGEAYKQTLDGRKVSDVAKALVEAGYTRDKRLILTACGMEQKVAYHSSTLTQLLTYELKKALKEANLDSNVSSKNIETFGAGKTILLNDMGANPKMFNIPIMHRDKIDRAMRFQWVLTVSKRLTVTLTDERDEQFYKIFDRNWKKIDTMERFKYGLITYFYKDKALSMALESDLLVAQRMFMLAGICLAVGIAGVLSHLLTEYVIFR